MIQLIKYNQPTITNRIYRKGSFKNIEKIKDNFFIVNINKQTIISQYQDVKDMIFTCKLYENNNGIFLYNFKFIENKENEMLLKYYYDIFVGLSIRSIGRTKIGCNVVYDAELICADLIIDKFTQTDVKINLISLLKREFLMLEFIPYNNDRYGDLVLNI